VYGVPYLITSAARRSFAVAGFVVTTFLLLSANAVVVPTNNIHTKTRHQTGSLSLKCEAIWAAEGFMDATNVITGGRMANGAFIRTESNNVPKRRTATLLDRRPVTVLKLQRLHRSKIDAKLVVDTRRYVLSR